MKFYFKKSMLSFFFSGCIAVACFSQNTDSLLVTNLREVQVIGYKAMNGTGHLNEIQGAVIYSGKKTAVIEVDSIDANKAINNTRQILGRIPGLNIVESETGGFVANGIGIRGLNPVQSLEMNVRQNGYNVAADVYGYNETYYLPPMEAVARVEMIKGAAAIQFGSQMGGMVNYVLKEGTRLKSFDYSTMQTAGSNGLFNTYHSAGGTIKQWNYFAFFNYRTLAGWRPNSKQQQLTGYGKLLWQPNQRTKLGIEYSLLRNRIKMPGGLTDEQFEADSKASVRSRNWVKSPWNVITASLDYRLRKNTSLQIQSTYLKGERSLVWFNELPGVPDSRDPVTGNYAEREIDKESMRSLATEIRILHVLDVGKIKNTLATGVRFAVAGFDRNEEAPGSSGTDFDLTASGDFEENFLFTTVNIAAFMEDCIQVNERFSITPGIRLESLASEAEVEYEVGGIEKETEEEKSRSFILPALGFQYKTGITGSVYANVSKSYRPVDYAQLAPFGSVSAVDPNMKDPKGWSADIGMRNTFRNILNYDIGVFYLSYNNRIGLVNSTDAAGDVYTLRTNLDKSIHKGVESYIELNIARALQMHKVFGDLSIYNSFAYTRARYSEGINKGNQVEYAPEFINRIGASYRKNRFASSLQFSSQSDAFGDAANTVATSNPLVGRIPGYSVIDWSVSIGYKKAKFRAGINNLADKRYFTQRTDEYPGPGIIPSIGRGYYIGFGYNL